MNRGKKFYFHTKTTFNGFTLIELLIVVAIIAILAAIAVPNFLEAQIRSKVSRVKADLYDLALAIESYSVDNNTYPFYCNILDGYGPLGGRPSDNEGETTFLPYSITTPVSYLSSLPIDAFPIRRFDSTGGGGEVVPPLEPSYPYMYRRYFSRSGAWNSWLAPDGEEYTIDYRNIGNNVRKLYDSYYHKGWAFTAQEADVSNSAMWVVGSPGSDLKFPALQRSVDPQYFSHVNPHYPDTHYDPTNGTVSVGDILRFGP